MQTIRTLSILAALGLGSALAQVQVSATTGFIADMVRNVGGNRVNITQVVPNGSDPHSYDPRPTVVQGMSRAKVVFANGLNLEPFFEKLEANLPKSARVVELAAGMPNLIKGGEHHDEHKDEHSKEAGHAEDQHGHGEYDPHLWLSPAYGVRYVERIRDALIAADPSGRAVYTQNAGRYIAQIRQADADVKACLANIPVSRRKIVSQHEALLYFARQYNITIVGSIADFSAQQTGTQRFTRLAQEMRRQGVRTVFAEPQFSQAEARALAEATGARVGRIYSDAFDDTVNTYLKLLAFNGRAACESFR
ncbi:MAG: metal ABC transporter substrate-binding protein [Meiothermus sp.]|nr:metal ABC transporter substrate-binding protein [Meiothermus sp.]